MKINLDPLIEKIRETVRAHALPNRPGAYTRFAERKQTPDEYGCADAANIRYTIGDFERNPALRAAAVAELQALQDPETGLFKEESHHPFPYHSPLYRGVGAVRCGTALSSDRPVRIS